MGIRNSFLIVNTTKICQFKAKDSEIKIYSLHLGNISRDFYANNMKKSRIKCETFDTSNIIDIHKYLMKKHDIKECLG